MFEAAFYTKFRNTIEKGKDRGRQLYNLLQADELHIVKTFPRAKTL